jgi:Protein of unknown function (DUF2752)
VTDQPAAPHLVILSACASILLLALWLHPVAAGESLRIAGEKLPSLCIMKQAIGLPCPGCGLTRSLVAAVHGEWGVSLAHHRMGILVLFYLLLQVLGRLAWLGLSRVRGGIAICCRALDRSVVPLLLLLVLNWIPTFVGATLG